MLRMVKRLAHFSIHSSDIFHCYLSTQPPASPLAGFYRALLRLSQHNWDVTPLIVDLSAEGKELQNPAIQAEIVNKFNALRNNSTEESLLSFYLYLVSTSIIEIILLRCLYLQFTILVYNYRAHWIRRAAAC